VSSYEQFDRILHAHDSHRESGVFSFVSLLSPVESMKTSSQSSRSSQLFVRSRDARRKSFFAMDELYTTVENVPGRRKHGATPHGPKTSEYEGLRRCYLMNRVSRSWSRPTKDFMVRNLPKSS
jgi:hypothetical protein